MKLKLTPPPLPFLKMISRLRENCSEMCSVQSFVKIRIFKLSEFPCYKLIFEYFMNYHMYIHVYIIISILYFDTELFSDILFYFQLLNRKIRNVCMKSYVESEYKTRG